jgi:hypothetical protein
MGTAIAMTGPTRVIVAVLLVGAAAGCSTSACDKQVVYAAPAPDGRSIAFIYHRICGTSRDVSTHVSILPYGESLREGPGNVLAVAGDQSVKVSWQGARRLKVSEFHDPTRLPQDPIAGITIEFAAVTAPEPR